MARLPLPLIACLAAAPAVHAQTAPNACGFLSKAEVDQLINRGKAVTGTPVAIPSAGGKGSVCDYPGGAQVVIYVGPNSHSHLEPMLKWFGVKEQDKKPVSGIGDKAYMFYHSSKNPVENAPYLVMTVGTSTVVTQIAAYKSPVDNIQRIYCGQTTLSASEKADCAKALADKDEPLESVWPAVQELGKVVAAKVRAGKF